MKTSLVTLKGSRGEEVGERDENKLGEVEGRWARETKTSLVKMKGGKGEEVGERDENNKGK